jgi:hypothetical protein
MKNGVNCGKVQIVGNAKVISLTLNWNDQQIMYINYERLRFFLLSEGMKGGDIHRQLAAKYGQNCLPQ